MSSNQDNNPFVISLHFRFPNFLNRINNTFVTSLSFRFPAIVHSVKFFTVRYNAMGGLGHTDLRLVSEAIAVC